MAESPWQWRDGTNPYRNTAFQVLDLDVDVRGRKAIKEHIDRRRQRIRNAPERYKLFGRELREEDIAHAASRITDPGSRLYEELLTHRPRRLDTSKLARVVADLRELQVLPDQLPLNMDQRRLLRAVPRMKGREFAPIFPWWRSDNG
jgi:hypothetical protein